jgi:hypothetical protein
MPVDLEEHHHVILKHLAYPVSSRPDILQENPPGVKNMIGSAWRHFWWMESHYRLAYIG